MKEAFLECGTGRSDGVLGDMNGRVVCDVSTWGEVLCKKGRKFMRMAGGYCSLAVSTTSQDAEKTEDHRKATKSTDQN